MEKLNRAASICARAAEELRELLPDSRDKSLALTKIEEAGHWATACLAKNSSTENIIAVPSIIKPN